MAAGGEPKPGSDAQPPAASAARSPAARARLIEPTPCPTEPRAPLTPLRSPRARAPVLRNALAAKDNLAWVALQVGDHAVEPRHRPLPFVDEILQVAQAACGELVDVSTDRLGFLIEGLGRLPDRGERRPCLGDDA